MIKDFLFSLWCTIVGHRWVKVSDDNNVAETRCERCNMHDLGESV